MLVGMELIRTADDLVTRIALVRAMRGLTHAKLGMKLGVDAVKVLHWERGQEQMTPAQCKRAGLVLRWRWQDFMAPPLPHEDAWGKLVEYRQAAAKAE